jgi:hypothetical protein
MGTIHYVSLTDSSKQVRGRHKLQVRVDVSDCAGFERDWIGQRSIISIMELDGPPDPPPTPLGGKILLFSDEPERYPVPRAA